MTEGKLRRDTLRGMAVRGTLRGNVHGETEKADWKRNCEGTDRSLRGKTEGD